MIVKLKMCKILVKFMSNLYLRYLFFQICGLRKIFRCLYQCLALSVCLSHSLSLSIYSQYLSLYTFSLSLYIYIKICYFYVCTWYCNVPWIYKHKEQQVNISYSPWATFISLLFQQPLPFLERNVPFPIFLKNKQNSNPHPTLVSHIC